MKKIGFLSFGHWAPSPQSRTQSATDALLQSIDLAVEAESLGMDGAYFRVHHFAQQLASVPADQPEPTLRSNAASRRGANEASDPMHSPWQDPALPQIVARQVARGVGEAGRRRVRTQGFGSHQFARVVGGRAVRWQRELGTQ